MLSRWIYSTEENLFSCEDPMAIKFLSLLIILTLLPRSQPQQGSGQSYAGFTSDASAFPLEADYYDYIVIGGGTAGCPLSATLSAHHRVLVLERGGAPHEFPSLQTVDGFLPTLAAGGGADSPAESFMSDDGVPNARGRVLGGSSAINAGFYSRAHPGFFDESGADWEMDLVEKAYEWVEAKVAFRPALGRWQTAVRDGLLEAAHATPYNGYTVNHVEGTKIGASTFDSNGRRHSAADLLELANPDNFRVATRATVDRILINSSSTAADPSAGSQAHHQASATGVAYRDRLGRLHHALLRPGGEAILSAGAIGSPQLLLLSGIGPRPYLSSLGIPVAVDHPDVGQHVYDNPRNGISIVTPAPLEHSLIQVVGINSTAGTFIKASSNVLPGPPRRSRRFSRTPDRYYATILEKIAGPTSVGSLRLASLDVRATPRVRFNYFSTKQDLDRCVSGLRGIAEVLDARSMEQFKTPTRRSWLGRWRRGFRFMGPELPANRWDDGAMAEHCRRTVSTIWHYHGGCVVGKVVDREYRVAGVRKLRVIDGSTLTVSPGTNPQATLMMMGRYMGLKINLQRRNNA